MRTLETHTPEKFTHYKSSGQRKNKPSPVTKSPPPLYLQDNCRMAPPESPWRPQGQTDSRPKRPISFARSLSNLLLKLFTVFAVTVSRSSIQGCSLWDRVWVSRALEFNFIRSWSWSWEERSWSWSWSWSWCLQSRSCFGLHGSV